MGYQRKFKPSMCSNSSSLIGAFREPTQKSTPSRRASFAAGTKSRLRQSAQSDPPVFCKPEKRYQRRSSYQRPFVCCLAENRPLTDPKSEFFRRRVFLIHRIEFGIRSCCHQNAKTKSDLPFLFQLLQKSLHPLTLRRPRKIRRSLQQGMI